MNNLSLIGALRKVLHQSGTYWQIRDVMDEGLANGLHRIPRQRAILSTPPILTDSTGTSEVRILTYRGDWLNAMWALKSFYIWSQVRLPLHIHDGGLLPRQARVIRQHFPNATFHDVRSSNRRVEEMLSSSGYTNSIWYRQKNKNMWKFFDFYLGNSAERVITMDSDVLFFDRADELLEASTWKEGPNVFNRDFHYCYVQPQERMNEIAGTSVPPFLNGGLGCVRPKNIDFDFVEQCLSLPEINTRFGNVEQSIQALCASRSGLKLLSDKYIVSTKVGMPERLVAKHYPSPPRPLLYQEGMARLLADKNWHQRMNSSGVHSMELGIAGSSE